MSQDTHILPSGVVMDSRSDGWVCLTGLNSEQVVTSAAELAYMLQHYQNRWRGIPVKMDLSQWRGMIGTPEKS